MAQGLKKGLFRLGLGLFLLFLFLGFYMRSLYIGSMYRTVDGYLIVLPVARLGLMVLVVGVFAALARPLSEITVDSIALATPNMRWSEDDTNTIFYKGFLYRVFLLVLLGCGYFMLAPNLSRALIPLEGYGWVPLVFGLAWFAMVLALAMLFALRVKQEYPVWRAWAATKKASKRAFVLHVPAPAQAATASAPAAAAPVSAPAPTVPPTSTDAKIKFCKKCGSAMVKGEDSPSCANCGWKP